MAMLVTSMSSFILLYGVSLNITFITCLGAVTSLISVACLIDALMLQKEAK